MLVWILFIILIILQTLDIYSTKRIISDKGGKELNPIMKFIINKFGLLPGLIITKTIVMFVFAAGIFFAAPNTIIISILLFAIILIYVYVVYKNFKVLGKIKSK